MLLWKTFFHVMICLFGCNYGSEFIVPPNDGKMRYFRGFQTDEFHFKIKNDATNAKNISYIYLLDNLNARTNYGKYMRISVHYDLHGTTWLNIYSCNSGLTASERATKFRDKPDKDGFRGYWIRHQRHLFNGLLNRWEFGQEWDNVHPVLKLALKFPFFPQYFALEGFSTWKLEQKLLGGRPSPSFGFFSSADLSMVHMPTFYPPMAGITAPKTGASNDAAPESSARQILKFSRPEISSTTPQTTRRSSTTKGTHVFNDPFTYPEGSTSTTKTPSSTFKFSEEKKFNYLKNRRGKTQNLHSKLNHTRIEMKLSNVTFPKIPTITLPSISVPKITLPRITFPKINIPSVTLPSVTVPKITWPAAVTIPSIPYPNVTFPSIEIPMITLLPTLHSANKKEKASQNDGLEKV